MNTHAPLCGCDICALRSRWAQTQETRKKPKKIGRPKLPKGHAKTIVMQARVQPQEKAAYAQAAKARGVDLSTWVRDTLNRCLEPRDGQLKMVG